MPIESSGTSFAAANLLCAIWSITGYPVKGADGLAEKLVPSSQSTQGWSERIYKWVNRSRSDESSEAFDKLQAQAGQIDAENGAPYTEESFKEIINSIVRTSVGLREADENDRQGHKPLDQIILFVRDGLIRGCALNEPGIEMLSDLLRSCADHNSQNETDSLVNFTIKATEIIAGRHRKMNSRRDRDYPTYRRVVKPNKTIYGTLGPMSAGVPNDGDDPDKEMRPFAALSALSHLCGGKLGWQDGTTKEIEGLFPSAVSANLLKSATPETLQKRLGESLGRMDAPSVIDMVCPDHDEEAYKEKCEAFLDGLVASFFVPEEVIEWFRRSYDNEKGSSWRNTLSQLIEMLISWCRSWSQSFSALNAKCEIDGKAIKSQLPADIIGRSDLIDSQVNAFQGHRKSGKSIGVRIAFKGNEGYGKRTVALELSRRLLELDLVDHVFEIHFSKTASDTLESLVFTDDQGSMDSNELRDRNAERLQKLPPRTLVLLSGVVREGFSAEDEKECWDYLTSVGMADLIITADIIKDGDLREGYQTVRVENLDEGSLISIYCNISKALGNSKRAKEHIDNGVRSAAGIVKCAYTDASLTESEYGNPFEPETLRDNSGNMRTELKVMAIASLLPVNTPASIVGALLPQEPRDELTKWGWTDPNAKINGGALRNTYRGYCTDGLSDDEWGSLCDDIASAINTKLLRGFSSLPRTTDASERVEFREELTCAVELYETMQKITEEHTGDGAWRDRSLGLLADKARWLDILSKTQKETEARELRLRLLMDSDDPARQIEALFEGVTIAKLRGRLGYYKDGMDLCSKVVSIILNNSELNPCDVDDVCKATKNSGLSNEKLLVLTRALRTRGYIAHDLWEDNGRKSGMLGLQPAIKDKKAAYEIAMMLDEPDRSPELVRTLTTLAYSYFRMGDVRNAIELNSNAINGFDVTACGKREKVDGLRRLAEAGEQDEWVERNRKIELAAALNSQGYFLSPEDDGKARTRKNLKEALKFKREALKLREQCLSPVHMDLARSHNNLAITLADLGRLSEAKEHVNEAVGIRGKRFSPGESGHTLIDKNLKRIDTLLSRRKDLDTLACSYLQGHQGTYAVYASDENGEHVISLRCEHHGTDFVVADAVETKDQDIDVFESGSTIKIFIDTVLQLLISKGEINGNQTLEYRPGDYVGGSGVLKLSEPGGSYKLSDVATWMVAVSDNIATNMVIRLLKVERINREIRSMGFEWTKVLHKLDFPTQHDFGRTTAKELGRLLRGLIDEEPIVPKEVANKVLEHLGKQQNSKIISPGIPPYLTSAHDERENAVTVLSKSGTMNDVRAEAGIVKTSRSTYVVVLMAKDFPDTVEYDNHPSILALRKVSSFLFSYYSTLALSY